MHADEFLIVFLDHVELILTATGIVLTALITPNLHIGFLIALSLIKVAIEKV